jgi:hypothetical protein
VTTPVEQELVDLISEITACQQRARGVVPRLGKGSAEFVEYLTGMLINELVTLMERAKEYDKHSPPPRH